MGTWGAGISANDEFLDVKEKFFDLFYYETITAEEIENQILSDYRNEISNETSYEWHNVFFALAYCEWKCGCLGNGVLAKAESIITGGKDLDYWKELSASGKTLQQREKALNKFLAQLKSKNEKPIKRRLKKRFVMPLKTGDVFACYSKARGYYGCGVALQVGDSRLRPWEEEYRFSALLALSELTPSTLPTIEQVITANVRDVFWNGGSVYNLPARGIVVIGNVAERIDENYDEYFGSFVINGKTYRVGKLRPKFDDLIAPNCERTVDEFTVSGKPMWFFFKKSNLRKTDEILKK